VRRVIGRAAPNPARPRYDESVRQVALVLVILAAATSAFAQVRDDARDRRARDEALQEQFFVSQGAHFTILFDGPKDYALASRALEVLEDAYFRIGTALYTFPDEPITVILYTQEQFRDVTRAPDWAAGAYDGRIRIPIRGALEQPDELERVLSHELTHAMIRTIAPQGVPLWLNEGLAVAFEPQGREWADAELGRQPARLPYDRLTRSFTSFSGDEARLAYAQSAQMAQSLLDDAGGATLVAILKDLAAGTSFKTAYEQHLFLPFTTFTGTFDPGR
jgi:hypothetical protein